MRKELLLRHIQGESSASEQEQVLQWIGRSERNRHYYIDLKNLWVSQTLPHTKATSAELASINTLTTQKKAGRNKARIIPWVTSAIAAAAILALVLVLSIPGKSDKVLYDFAGIPTQYKHTVYTESGVKSRVTLPDGSKVWLNAESSITYPDQFQGGRREIFFSGEGYFEVAQDSLHPMRIFTGKDFDVEVLGTSFNLKCYDDEPSATATLYKGSIRLVASNGQHVDIQPDQTCLIAKKHTYSEIPSVKLLSNQKAVALKQAVWKEGRLLFEATPMDEVVKMLRRWYGVEIVVQDSGVMNHRFTAEFASESIQQVAEMLHYTARINYRLEGSTLYLFSR